MFLKIITNWGWTMYLHKENKELFRDIISIVSERKNVTTDIVEKDYYVTMILYLLSQKEIEKEELLYLKHMVLLIDFLRI